MLSQQKIKFGRLRHKDKTIFFILGSHVNIRRYDVDFFVSTELKTQRALLG